MTTVLVYVLDAVRCINCSTYGYDRDTTPCLSSIAEHGTALTGVSPATWTLPAAACILTGTRPFAHRTLQMDDRLSTDLKTLPETLGDRVTSTAITAAGYTSSEFGYNRGFDKFEEVYRSDAARKWTVSASELNDHILDKIDNIEREDDTFLFVWSTEPHWPYEADTRWGDGEWSDFEGDLNEVLTEFGSQAVIDRYDDQIKENDDCLLEIVEALRSRELYEDTCLIVVGDHGECFEDGVSSIGGTVTGYRNIPYQELAEVPFVIKPHGEMELNQGHEIASLIDVLPTVCDIFDEPIPDQAQGISLLEGTPRKNAVVQVYDRTGGVYESIRDHDWTYIRIRNDKSVLEGIRSHLLRYVRTRWLQNTLLLPIESGTEIKTDRSGEYPDIIQRYNDLLDEISEEDRKVVEIQNTTSELSEETKQNLKRLGYVD